ncbi:MAG: family 20 glycosylhydrolase [Akkermansia sp.]|nr:family 20 glycosylhydrolase [Akkermansia sp.]
MKVYHLLVACLCCVADAALPLPQYTGGTSPAQPLPLITGAYELSLSSQGWQCNAADDAGRFYAEQTKQQLLHQYGEALPDSLYVQDYPEYEWRGLHLDVSRHFFDKATVMQLLDRMAELKLNRLHLHLTDGPGWRIEIKSYPLLTQQGAWRKKLHTSGWNWHDNRLGTNYPELYGGFYTQEDMKELIAYAAARHIMIVPEVDMPGHFAAALEAYPHLAHPAYKTGNWPYSYDFLNVQEPCVLEFAYRVLDELMAIFPKGTPIHVGGDEVDLHLVSAEQQRVFVQALVDYLQQHGYPAITWDEAATHGVRGQIVMLWRGEKAEEVLSLGLPTILCPNSHFYFDYPQSDSPSEPESMPAPVISTEKVFGYTPPSSSTVIGIQGNLWSEYIYTPELLFYKAFPRAAAMAERAWGSPLRPFSEFYRDYVHLIDKGRQE